MSPMAIAWIVFGCVFVGALLGMFLRTALPQDHLSVDSKDVVKVSIALIATMGALVLSLLISSAKSTYDTRSSQLVQISGDVITLDHVLARYGPEAKDARSLLHSSVAAAIERFWPADDAKPAGFDVKASPTEALYEKIEVLSPQTEPQRNLQAQALKLAMDLGQLRFLLFENSGSKIPLPFLIVLVFWMTVIFISFGLFSPVNMTVITILLICGLSISGAIFLILELDRSFEGTMKISSAPFRYALARLGE
jgi:hypothetical protein